MSDSVSELRETMRQRQWRYNLWSPLRYFGPTFAAALLVCLLLIHGKLLERWELRDSTMPNSNDLARKCTGLLFGICGCLTLLLVDSGEIVHQSFNGAWTGFFTVTCIGSIAALPQQWRQFWRLRRRRIPAGQGQLGSRSD